MGSGGGGGGVLKAKFLRAMYENKLEFPGGGGCKTENFPWGEYGYFLELHNLKFAAPWPAYIAQQKCTTHLKTLRIVSSSLSFLHSSTYR